MGAADIDEVECAPKFPIRGTNRDAQLHKAASNAPWEGGRSEAADDYGRPVRTPERPKESARWEGERGLHLRDRRPLHIRVKSGTAWPTDGTDGERCAPAAHSRARSIAGARIGQRSRFARCRGRAGGCAGSAAFGVQRCPTNRSFGQQSIRTQKPYGILATDFVPTSVATIKSDQAAGSEQN
jgi:hypothetical protein